MVARRIEACRPLLAVTLAVCCVLLVSFVAEGTGGAVREELAAPASSSVAKDHSQEDVQSKLTNLATREHAGNKAARHQMRSVASERTSALLKREFTGIERVARQKVDKAAKAAAAEEAKKHTLDSHLSVSPQKKLAILRRDDELMKAAVKKEQAGAKHAKALALGQAAHFKTAVKDKMKAARHHLATLQKQLSVYKGTKKTQAKARKDLELLHSKIAHITEHLAARRSRLHRIVHRQHQHVQDTKVKIKKSQKKLKKLLVHYRTSLTHLKKKLKVVNKAADVNIAIGTRINTSRDVLKQQKKKITQLRSDVKKMTAELFQTKRKTDALKIKAKQRKHQLHQAHAKYKQLSRKIADLDKKAKQRASKVDVHVPRGSSAAQTNKAVHQMTRAVRKASGGKKAKAALLQRMIHAASSAAVKEASKFRPSADIKVPGINHALDDVAKMTTDLDLLGESENVAAAHSASEAVEFRELNRNAMSAHQVHQAELLAHVAHSFFKKAIKTGKTSDHLAARAAMKRAIAAHDALDI